MPDLLQWHITQIDYRFPVASQGVGCSASGICCTGFVVDRNERCLVEGDAV